MNQWKLGFALLLPLSLCFAEETMVKHIGRESDFIPICSTATLHIITLIVCKIETKGNRGEGCRLLYQHGQDFERECDSRFTLMTKNQTVFLQLDNLTSEDSGKYTCECSHAHGTDYLHLNITVEANEESSTSPMTVLQYTAVTGTVAAFVVVTAFLGLILVKKHCREHTTSGPSGLPEEDDRDDLYTSLQRPASDLYQTMSSVRHRHDTDNDAMMTNPTRNTAVMAHLEQEITRREAGQTYEIYENLLTESPDLGQV